MIRYGMRQFAKNTACIRYRSKNAIRSNFNIYLGILFSNDLKWTPHIASTTKKANSTLGFLRRNLGFFPQNCKRNAYLSLVRPLLEYGCITWSPYAQRDIDQIEKVQRLSARFITNDYTSRFPGPVTSKAATAYSTATQKGPASHISIQGG